MDCPERQLWATVLRVAIEDALSATGCGIHESRRAQDWIGTFPSINFREVCDLAGLDGDAVHDRVVPAMRDAKAAQEAKYAWLNKRRDATA